MNHQFFEDLTFIGDGLIMLLSAFEDMHDISYDLKLLIADMYYKTDKIHTWLISNYRKEEHFV